MSFSDSESGSNRGNNEYKNFRMTSRDRLLYEMLKSTSNESKSWKVLIMDKVTVKVMSSSCKMADITDQGISLVEDLFRRRQPLPSLDAIYFIQPSKENLVMFLSDMSGREPLYKKAFVFFCQPVPKDLINHIKSDMSVVPRIGALREMNLEFFPVDSQVFVTDHDMAMEELYGETSQNARKFDACMNLLAIRIATVFASLKEFPYVRYQAPKDPDTAAPNELIPKKLASAVWERLTTYKSTIPNFPQKETCEFIILDRSVDQIAPVIHEWTYDAMCHDLLEMDGNKLTLEVINKATGQPEKKEIILDDTDPVWLEIRHLHIAEASEWLHEKMTNFASKNKAAALSKASKEGTELSTRDLQKMVQALPQYTETMEKLSLHVEIRLFQSLTADEKTRRSLNTICDDRPSQIAGKVNTIIRDMELRDLGQLEQDIVFGDAATKEIINFLRTNQDASVENKLRLLMIYACVHPDKFEGDKASKLLQLAKLSGEDMKAIKKMIMLAGSSESKKKSAGGGFSLKFDGQRKKIAARKDKTNAEEESWALSKFYPTLEDIIEDVNKGSLSKTDYQYINEPVAANKERSQSSSSSASTTTTTGGPRSVRSRRTATWARPHHSEDGSADSVLRHSANDFKMMGSRIFIFIIGGATRSELRTCYKFTTKLRREIILGSTSIDDPPKYLTKLKLLGLSMP